MKDEAPSSLSRSGNMGPSCSTTPTKAASDEILSSLLRFNNFDSISNLKDESLDIDLSACVTITAADTAAILNGNSLSSNDFWRMLDENAQATSLMHLLSYDNSNNKFSSELSGSEFKPESSKMQGSSSSSSSTTSNNFGDNFLRPSLLASPLRKNLKTSALPAEQTQLKFDFKAPSSTAANQPAVASASNNAVCDLSGAIRCDFLREIKVEKVEDEAEQQKITMTPTNIVNSSSPSKIMASANKSPTTATTTSSAIAANSAESPTSGVTFIRLYKCLTCNGAIIRNEEEIKKHEVAKHRILHRCSVCERDFEQENGLKKHMKAHRSVDSRKDAWKKCPDCGKCLKMGSMWMHRKIHSENKKYGCDICGQKFVQKINLTHHSRIHTAEKPYECPECQKRFQERSHLQRHQKLHAQTRSYRCEKCGKMYKTERCLKVHNLVHLEQRPFACTVCDKSFISNSKLKQHSNIHTGERPFKCNYCPRDFTNFPNWLKHTRRRHKVDHKTGEHLENIPSYCSKKSTKTTKNNTKQQQQQGASTSVAGQEKKDVTKTKDGIPNNNGFLQQTTTTTTLNDNPKTANNAIGILKNTPLVGTTTLLNKTTEPVMIPSHSNNTNNNTMSSTNKSKKKVNQIVPTVVSSSNSLQAGLAISAPTTTTTKTMKMTTLKTEMSVNIRDNLSSGGAPSNAMMMPPLNPFLPEMNSQVRSASAAPVNGLNSTTNNNNNSGNIPSKAKRPKRERKQATPKQVQKALNVAASLMAAANSQTTMPQQQLVMQIKKEPGLSANKKQSLSSLMPQGSSGSLTDIHALSLTSAEEFIMEQALELEESVFYDAPISNIADTDNAISSEADVARHFKIKHEYNSDIVIKEEEFISVPMKEPKNRLLCSSLESSPFSSPASVETQTKDLSPPINMLTTDTARPVATVYMPTAATFSLNSQNAALVSRLYSINANNNRHDLQTLSGGGGGGDDGQSLMNQFHCIPLVQFIQQPVSSATTTTTTLAGSASSPSSSSSLLATSKNQQALPSVETLLFSNAQHNNSFFLNKNSVTLTVSGPVTGSPVMASSITPANLLAAAKASNNLT